ncbi:MAG: hypothetical protein JRD89_11470 [Deltaproteobacteria bacterium]|nr:hypothetical protein [Deltaproteobacteria bacterium]
MLNEETGEWEESRELRDAAEDLLAFKRFRDELERGGRERLTVKPVPKPGGAPAGGQALTVEEGQELILMVEQRDEQQIMQEILGDVLRQYVYRFEVGGRVVTNVSYAGIKEAARRRGNVHVTKVEVEETKDGQAVIGKAEVYDLQNNFKTWGVAVQRKRMRLRDGREVEDDFCVQKAVSKAIRNGLRACVPEKLIAERVTSSTFRDNEGNDKRRSSKDRHQTERQFDKYTSSGSAIGDSRSFKHVRKRRKAVKRYRMGCDPSSNIS